MRAGALGLRLGLRAQAAAAAVDSLPEGPWSSPEMESRPGQESMARGLAGLVSALVMGKVEKVWWSSPGVQLRRPGQFGQASEPEKPVPSVVEDP